MITFFIWTVNKIFRRPVYDYMNGWLFTAFPDLLMKYLPYFYRIMIKYTHSVSTMYISFFINYTIIYSGYIIVHYLKWDTIVDMDQSRPCPWPKPSKPNPSFTKFNHGKYVHDAKPIMIFFNFSRNHFPSLFTHNL